MSTLNKINQLIIKYAISNESNELIKQFVKKCYDSGGINEEYFKEFCYFEKVFNKPIKRIIFVASDKVENVFTGKIDTISDITYGDLTIIYNDSFYLIYEKSAYGTITLRDLKDTYQQRFRDELYYIVNRFSTTIEQDFHDAYQNFIYNYYKNHKKFLLGNYPSLLPKYLLKNRSVTTNEHEDLENKVIRSVSFGMVLKNRIILIDIQGEGYYHSSKYKLIYERVIERELKLEGYELYKFGESNIIDKNENQLEVYVREFFLELFNKHNISL